MSDAEPALIGYNIFDHPSDFPDHYVLRGWTLYRGVEEPVVDAKVLLSADIEALRDLVRARFLTCFPRKPEDSPSLVETWI